MGFDMQRVIAAYQAGAQIKRQKEQREMELEDRDFERKRRAALDKSEKLNDELLRRRLAQENAAALQNIDIPEKPAVDLAATPGGRRQDTGARPQPQGPPANNIQAMLQQVRSQPVPLQEASIPGVSLPREQMFPNPVTQVPGVPSLGVPGYEDRAVSKKDRERETMAAQLQAMQLERLKNTYTVEDPSTGQNVTAPKEILDNLLTQTGAAKRQGEQQDFTAKQQAGQQDFSKAQQLLTIAAANQRHREDIEQRRLDREQRLKEAALRQTDKPPTAANLRTFGFYMGAKDAVDVLDQLESDVQSLGLLAQGWQKWAPNFLQTQLGQTYEQTQRQFTEARLRKDSGAAIPEHEYENDKRTYFVQPGDTPVTLERKKAARAVLIQALQRESGRAYTQSFGEEAGAGGADPLGLFN